MSDPLFAFLPLIIGVAAAVGCWIGVRIERIAPRIHGLAWITVEIWGELTLRPQVSVGIANRTGAQSIYDFDATPEGIASAQMYGNSLARMAGLPVIDRTGDKIPTPSPGVPPP